ncbi:hypothetical protein [uncultured Xanthomonas sp.]|nr:hypothetical protein [uncultured Xanthomonas sp.]
MRLLDRAIDAGQIFAIAAAAVAAQRHWHLIHSVRALSSTPAVEKRDRD